MTQRWALALHGGAGAMKSELYAHEEAHMSDLLAEGARLLEAGESALDVVTAMVEALEACGLHVAGRGAGPNAQGIYELDASIMNGATREAGAVAALVGFQSPVRTARAVMEKTPHVLLAGAGAAAFAAEHGLARVDDPASYYAPARSGLPVVDAPKDRGAMGTVGAVALDSAGQLAAATSTGGIANKLSGRVGDTPIIGAGCWADRRVAVSCTGVGEFFMRANVAADVSARLGYLGQTLDAAAQGALDDMAALGGSGGLIAVDAYGHFSTPFNTQGMKRAIATRSGVREVKTFR